MRSFVAAVQAALASGGEFVELATARGDLTQRLVVAAAGVAAPPGSSAWLEVSKDGEVVSRLPLPPPSGSSSPAAFTVGRAPGCGLALEHASVSRAHATLTWRGAAWVLHDASSAHGTWLDGTRLQPGAEAQLRDGAVMRFGASSRSVAFREGQPASSAKRRSRSRSRSRSPQRRKH
jgi:hypothetical protein